MQNIKKLLAIVALCAFCSPAFADECATLEHDIHEFQTVIAHIREHGQITKSDAQEAMRDLKVARDDLNKLIKSGEADAEEVALAKKAIAAITATIKALRVGSIDKVIQGLEGILAVMMEYKAHAHCGETPH